MGFYVYVCNLNLKPMNGDISKALKDSEFFLEWGIDKDGSLDLNDSYSFKWSEYFERDLLFLQELGVRGDLEINDDFSAYTLYKLKDKAVEVYGGDIVYPEAYSHKLEKNDTLKL